MTLHLIWYWLTQSSAVNATALAALVALLATFLSFLISAATLYVVVRQTGAANRQAAASEAQVKSAVDAGRLSEAQLIATIQAAEAEKRHGDLVRYQLLDMLTPVIVFSQEGNAAGERRFYIENQGKGAAYGISVAVTETGSQTKGQRITPSHDFLSAHTATYIVTNETGASVGLHIEYKSVDGRNFETFVSINPSRTYQNFCDIWSTGERTPISMTLPD